MSLIYYLHREEYPIFGTTLPECKSTRDATDQYSCVPSTHYSSHQCRLLSLQIQFHNNEQNFDRLMTTNDIVGGDLDIHHATWDSFATNNVRKSLANELESDNLNTILEYILRSMKNGIIAKEKNTTQFPTDLLSTNFSLMAFIPSWQKMLPSTSSTKEAVAVSISI